MSELLFIGSGLFDERDVSLRGLEEMRDAEAVFVERYTSLMAGLSVGKLEKLIGKKVSVISRQHLEEENGQIVLQEARQGKAVLLVPGDPLIATTHVDLRIRAEKAGIPTRIIHAASIISAAIGLSGLQNYKFGRSVTVPFPEEGFISETPYQVIKENKEMGLHTLCFLDIKVEEDRYMTVEDGLQTLLTVEKRKRNKVITSDTLVIGIARVGSKNPAIKAGYSKEVMKYDFGKPPHTIIFPRKLHFMEAEALIALAGAPKEIRNMVT